MAAYAGTESSRHERVGTLLSTRCTQSGHLGVQVSTAIDNNGDLPPAMPPRFKPGDRVLFDNSPQNHPFGAHKPERKAGSIHVVADGLPFTLSTGQAVNVPDLGLCTAVRVEAKFVKLKEHKHGKEPWMPVTDVDEPVGTPIPSYELKGQVDGKLGDTFWAPENTLTLVKAHDPNVFLSTDWHRPGAQGYRRSTRSKPSSKQAATNAWSNF